MDTPARDFSALVDAIRQVHAHCATQASRAVNTALTLRNWAIGCHIREYEQHGADRAEYGDALLETLARALQSALDKGYTGRYLGLCRQFYATYPQIRKSAISELPAISGASDDPIGEPISLKWGVSGDELIRWLSFTHLVELTKIEDPLKRAFYEVECIRGNWSVRALKRQIASLYFERSGLSIDKEKLAAMAHAAAEQAEPKLTIRDPYIFEFLGLKPREAMTESDLEDALLENLQEFLLELGHGFCLEARQKSILIGQTRGFVDLVFYHRILKCHVLVELKVDAFTHEHLGQLNTYVNWYRRHMRAEGDDPPIGLLLCTQKDQVLVEYALAGVDNQLFVSKYQLELPSTEDLQRFLEEKRRQMAEDT